MELKISPVNFSANNIVRKTYTMSKSAYNERMINAKKHVKQQKKYQLKNINKLVKLLKKAIADKSTLTLKRISEITGITVGQLINILYKNETAMKELKDLFNQVKDTSRLAGVPGEEDNDLARRLTNEASVYMTSSVDYVITAEEDYIQNLAMNLHNLNWNEETIEAFVKYFPSAPAFADMIISTKNELAQNRQRIISTPDSITNIFKAHEMNPDLTEDLLAELDGEGGFKYNLPEIYKIVSVNNSMPELLDLVKEDPLIIYRLFNLHNEERGSRFSGNEIKDLAEWYKKIPDLTQKLITDFYGCNINGRTYRFNGKQICYILEQYAKYPEISQFILNQQASYDNSYRFNGNQICKILSEYDKKKDFVEKLLKEDDSRFAGNDICKILSSYDDESKKFINRLVDERQTRADYEYNRLYCYPFTEYRFNGSKICELVDYYKKNPKLVTELLKAKTIDSNGEKVNKYCYYDIIRELNKQNT